MIEAASNGMMRVGAIDQSFFTDRSSGNCIQDNKLFCPGWVADNYDRYVDPTLQHLVLVGSAVAAGFLIAFALAILAHRHRFLQTPFLAGTGILYTIPSISFFFLLLPITGRGSLTAIIALTAFNLQIIFRNITTGLRNVPPDVTEAARGIGLTPSQILRQVELPLAMPEIIAGLRIATVSTVALATLAVFANGGGLGTEIVTGSNITFKTGIIVAGSIAVIMAIVFDGILLLTGKLLAPWKRKQAIS
ncbi:MAG: ABC transporter permease [Solirubrobacterales bacterium]|nr:ABC transporter permease [Solirubrobacterales bacterium]MCB8916228.1 ABC transporter permease [Thermoleophilales bacterium]